MKWASIFFKHRPMFSQNRGTGMWYCINWRHLGKSIFLITILLLYCEVLIYYVVLIQCTWPQIETKAPQSTVKAMILADTHLLGPRFGHWFDKFRREWQMYRAFQTTIALHNPEAVFIVGDIFDEGYHCSEEDFNNYIKRFHSVFSVPEKTKLYVAIGNHDIGFHYGITRKLKERFEKSFNTSSVEMVEIKGNIFVLMNSMALQGDNCFLCRPAEHKLDKVANLLKCAKMEIKSKGCESLEPLPSYSKPIFLQHFPLYRQSDAHCSEPDSAPPEIRNDPFRETWECLSKESTKKVLNSLDPRAIFTGHTHHGCLTIHKGDIPEWTIPSFNWRNKNNPTFLLGTFSSDNFAVTKCYMPQESTVITLYIVGGLTILIWFILTRWRLFRGVGIKDKLYNS